MLFALAISINSRDWCVRWPSRNRRRRGGNCNCNSLSRGCYGLLSMRGHEALLKCSIHCFACSVEDHPFSEGAIRPYRIEFDSGKASRKSNHALSNCLPFRSTYGSTVRLPTLTVSITVAQSLLPTALLYDCLLRSLYRTTRKVDVESPKAKLVSSML